LPNIILFALNNSHSTVSSCPFLPQNRKGTKLFFAFTFLLLLYNIGAGQFKETYGEGITRIAVMGDFTGAVLADSTACAYFVADCLAFVDSVSHRRYCRGGVSCLDKDHPLFARQVTRPPLIIIFFAFSFDAPAR
jgi:hypothetical protein